MKHFLESESMSHESISVSKPTYEKLKKLMDKINEEAGYRRIREREGLGGRYHKLPNISVQLGDGENGGLLSPERRRINRFKRQTG